MKGQTLMTFTSKSAGLSIVVKPARHTVSPDGTRNFVAGKRAEFRNGLFTTDDKEIINYLKNHRDYGVLFISEDKVIPKEELAQKEADAKKKERDLAKNTEAEATNKKPGKSKSVTSESNEDVTSQFKSE